MRANGSQRSFFWYIFPFTLMFVAAATCLVFYHSNQSQNQLFFSKAQQELSDRSEIVKSFALPLLESQRLQDLREYVDRINKESVAKISIFGHNNNVLAGASNFEGGDFSGGELPIEVKQAYQGDIGVSIRPVNGNKSQETIFVAQPIRTSSGTIIGVVRISKEANVLTRELDNQRNQGVLALAVVLIVVALFVWYWSQRMASPVQNLKNLVEEIATGKSAVELKKGRVLPNEFLSVVTSLNKIASEIDANKSEILQNQILQSVILGNMSEGIIAIGADGRIDHINKSAEQILGVVFQEDKRLAYTELVRLPVLLKLIRKSMSKQQQREREISVDHVGTHDKTFIARSNPVFSVDKVFHGLILVLLDVTEVRQLERHRQEFVSNVSHELKTPLTSIKGFAETMQNPALAKIDDFRSYSKIILKQANHLASLIDDLLMLSELENEEKKGTTFSEESQLIDLLDTAIHTCMSKAKKKGIEIDKSGVQPVKIQGQPGLITQAMLNLIENAIKYSPEKTKVVVSTDFDNGSFRVCVADQGPGIPSDQMNHLFERFYRVDKGRTRDQGGTGLGLSIVKHIMKVHGGEAEVESKINAGSRFKLCFPSELIKS